MDMTVAGAPSGVRADAREGRPRVLHRGTDEDMGDFIGRAAWEEGLCSKTLVPPWQSPSRPTRTIAE